ncbi:MAG: type II toxin-antitoxin system RelE/ParE family toxin [Nitrososphaera sp.]|nr:type II toxin-antitoxin system RelE/ParE family toxin [Nitrososphaera sp.]
MTYHIEYYGAVFREDIPRLSNEVLKRLEETIYTKLTTHPEIFGKPLRASLRGHRTLRNGDYRVIYRIEHTNVRVIVMRHRKDAYEEAFRRV